MLHDVTSANSLQWVVDNEQFLRSIVVAVCVKRNRTDLIDDIYTDVVIDRSARILRDYNPEKCNDLSRYVRLSIKWEISKWFKRYNRDNDRCQQLAVNDDAETQSSDVATIDENDCVSRFLEFVRAEDTQGYRLEFILRLRMGGLTNEEIAFHLSRDEHQVRRRLGMIQDLYSQYFNGNGHS